MLYHNSKSESIVATTTTKKLQTDTVLIVNESSAFPSSSRTDEHLSARKESLKTTATLFHSVTNRTDNDQPPLPPRSVIFYNIYINPARRWRNGMRVVMEHTQQMADLLTKRQQLQQERTPHEPPWPLPILYYNYIGYNHSKSFCPINMTCQFLHFYDKGMEDVTLQDVYQYCVEHPRDIVYYLHNKGSFTVSDVNDDWRRFVTKHLLSDDSISLLEQHDDTIMDQSSLSATSCNVVGCSWQPLPYWHFAANFWMAKCSYVRKLLPPKQFYDTYVRQVVQPLLHAKHRQPDSPYYCLASYFFQSKHTNGTTSGNNNNTSHDVTSVNDLTSEIQHAVGLGRYCHEHWISSHPDLVPCFARGPSVFQSTLLKTELAAANYYPHEWFRMHGRLYEFYQLYQRLPSKESYFYKYYQGTEDPLEPELCRQGKGRNVSAYYTRGA